MRRRVVAVIGASEPSDEERRLAFETGRRIAAEGWVLVTGGLGGVMEEASRGAREADGTVLGILPGTEANPHVEIAVATGLGDARNAVIANTADAFIAIGGGLGTLSEIAFALKRGKRVIALSTWKIDRSRYDGPDWIEVENPEAAVRRVRESLT